MRRIAVIALALSGCYHPQAVGMVMTQLAGHVCRSIDARDPIDCGLRIIDEVVAAKTAYAEAPPPPPMFAIAPPVEIEVVDVRPRCRRTASPTSPAGCQ